MKQHKPSAQARVIHETRAFVLKRIKKDTTWGFLWFEMYRIPHFIVTVLLDLTNRTAYKYFQISLERRPRETTFKSGDELHNTPLDKSPEDICDPGKRRGGMPSFWLAHNKTQNSLRTATMHKCFKSVCLVSYLQTTYGLLCPLSNEWHMAAWLWKVACFRTVSWNFM